jgi:hypothetical protein
MANRRLIAIVGSLLQMTSQKVSGSSRRISCKTAEGQMVEVPESHINDGYCDCWETGQDETTTDACAGVDYWGWALSNTSTEDADEMERYVCMCGMAGEAVERYIIEEEEDIYQRTSDSLSHTKKI